MPDDNKLDSIVDELLATLRGPLSIAIRNALGQADTGPIQSRDGSRGTTASVAKRWSISCYVAGDNNLSSRIKQDLAELRKGLSSIKNGTIRKVALFIDSTSEPSRTVVLNSDGTESTTVHDDNLPSGDPATLETFLKNHTDPETRNLVVLWGHGNGWKDFGRGALEYTGLFSPIRASQSLLSSFAGALPKKLILSSFLSGGKAFGIEDPTGNFIDAHELSNVLASVTDKLNSKIDVLAFDACLMATAEIACQVSPYADIFIGSVEKVPSNGLPYDDVLHALDSTTSPESGYFDSPRFCKDVTRAFVDAYSPGGDQYGASGLIMHRSPDTPVTLSCIDLNSLDAFLSGPFCNFVKAVSLASKSPQFDLIRAAAVMASPGYGPGNEYTGVLDFATNILAAAKKLGVRLEDALRNAIDDLQRPFNPNYGTSFVLSRVALPADFPTGTQLPDWYPKSRDTSGLTVYLPRSSHSDAFEIWKLLRISTLVPSEHYAGMFGL